MSLAEIQPNERDERFATVVSRDVNGKLEYDSDSIRILSDTRRVSMRETAKRAVPQKDADNSMRIAAVGEMFPTLRSFESPVAMSVRVGNIQSHYVHRATFEGVVLDLGDDYFQARLTPLMADADEQLTEISLFEVSEDDKSLVQVGAVFYWTIGYREERGLRSQHSRIKFRRLPGWSFDELHHAKRSIRKYDELYADE